MVVSILSAKFAFRMAYPKIKGIVVLHPQAQFLAALREIEQRMVKGASFPFSYQEVSDGIFRLEKIVEGVSIRHFGTKAS